jgi:hypothetical protein
MRYRIIIKEEAGQDIHESYHWFDEQQKGLGKRFLDELEIYFDVLSKYPTIYQLQKRNLRAAPLKTFPFIIIYVFHTSQDPKKKFRK